MMQTTQTQQATGITGAEDLEPIGHTTIGRTVYQIFRLPLGENTKRAGIQGNYALVGPNGASYLVTDHGPAYALNSVACGGSKHQHWTPAPRPLRGLERSHLSLILDYPNKGD